MDWIGLTIISALLQSINHVFDKFIIADELHDHHLATFSWSVWGFVAFTGLGFFLNGISFQPWIIIIGMCIGVLYVLGVSFYYRSISVEEVSRVAPILAAIPIFVTLYSIVFFQENPNLLNIIGMLSVIMGVLLISYRPRQKFSFRGGVFLAIIAAFCFAFKNILTKHLSLDGYSHGLLFWIGIGIFVSAVINFALHHHKLSNNLEKKGIKHFFISNLFGIGAAMFFTLAITQGPVSLVSFLERISIPLIFVISLILNHINPQLLNEKFNKLILFQKSLAVIIILAGSFLLIQ